SGSDVSSNDVFESDVSNRIRVYLDGLNIDDIEVGELCDSDDSRRLDSAHKSDSDSQNWPEFNLENDMSNPRLKVGILFKSKDSLKETAKCVSSHAGGNRYQVECGPNSQHVVNLVSLSNMLPILPPTLRRPPGRPTKVKRHKVGVHNQVVAPTQQQATPISK
ncbi:hypothetical protein Gotri_012251, partial [Gossypium trilobum]|nr:hypothetical protein [Gossypium trilobum]